ncbi:MAG TPA: RNA polymerase sigma factor [Caulobacteraceae bacterium]|jgi:RNA polymerase sigma-70 factor (ECF subfamily)
MAVALARDIAALGDAGLAALAARGDGAAARLVISRNNQRLYRVAWSILKSDSEAEDALQEGWLKAFAAMDRFAGQSSLATWLTRIVINEALGRRRSADRRRRKLEEEGVSLMEDHRQALGSQGLPPDLAAARRELAGLLEGAIARLPDPLRIVLILRDVDEFSVREAAEALDIPEATVKTRLFRARRRLRAELDPEVRTAFAETFPFGDRRCAALTAAILARLGIG